MPSIRIEPALIRQAVQPNALGLNVNFLADHAAARKRGQGFSAALRAMGARSLRYPGGEKSNEFLWSTPPWDKPRPTLALSGSEARLYIEKAPVTVDGKILVDSMDFDQFIEICRECGARPMICINLGSAYVKESPGKIKGTARAALLENAVEWVRYANTVKGYGVQDWELGNESYWRGSVAELRAGDYARDVIEFSRAMKAVDPTIRIGANGHVEKNFVSGADGPGGPVWWKHLFERAAADIDFIVVHPYPCFEWGSYDFFAHNAPCLTGAVDEAVEALREWAPPADAARIRVQATETNAFDWAASKWYQGKKSGWEWGNDTGHALVLFELLGQHLAHPRVDGVQVWTSRWFQSPSRLEDMLDDDNRLFPTGQAMGLWGRHLKTRLLALTPTLAGPAYASFNPDDKSLALFLMNKTFEPQSLSLELSGYSMRWKATASVFSGKNPGDTAPTLEPGGSWDSENGFPVPLLPPLSVTVIEFKAIS